MSQGSSNPTTDLKKVNGTTVDTSTGNASAGTQRVVLATNQPVIPISDNGGSLTVDGTVAVSSLPALPTGSNTIGTVDISATSLSALETINAAQSGTWNINNVSGTISLPTGASTSANQTTIIGHVDGIEGLLTTIDTDTGNIVTAVQLLDNAVVTSGTTNTTSAFQIAGYDGSLARTISTNTSGHINIADGGNSITVDGTVGVSGSVAVTGTFWQATQPVSLTSVPTHAVTLSADDTHDGAAGTSLLMLGAYASSTAQTAVSANGDAVRLWATTSGALNIADGGSTISIDDGNGSITVDGTVAVTGTFWQETQPVSGTVEIGATSLAALETINAAQSGTWNIGTVTTLTSITNPVAVTDNGGSLTVDAPVTTPVFVRLSDGAAAISTLPVSLASVPTHAVTQSGTWNINNISGTISLPTGAATAAKQPALGTAGTASADVITVQGIASMTALKVDGSAVTQPVSGTFWQATQPVSIAAAVAVTDNNGSLTIDDGGSSITVDGTVGVSGSVAVTGTFWQATQPVSGTVTATLAADDVHDGVAGTALLMGGAYASSTAPTAVVNGDAVRLWATTAGALNIADGGSTISIDDGAGSITVDGTVAATQSGTWNITNISGTVSLPTGAATETTLAAVKTAVEIIDNAISGTEMQVDVVAALPAGDNNIGNVDVVTLPSLPTGSNVIGAVTQSGSWTVTTTANDTHDGAAGTTGQMQVGYASTATPAAVSADGDAARFWLTRNGALNIADGGGSITVDGTFWQATQPVSIAAAVAVTDNSGSLTVDAPVGNPVYVRLSDGAAAITALPVTDNGTTLSIDDGGGIITVDGTVAATQSGTWNITSLTQFNGVAIALNAGTVSTGTLRVVNATGATGTQTNPSLSTTSATVLAASTSRLGATIYNGSTSTLYLRLSSSAASATVYTTKLYPDDYYEVPANYNGAITGILDTGTTTLVQVTQIT